MEDNLFAKEGRWFFAPDAFVDGKKTPLMVTPQSVEVIQLNELAPRVLATRFRIKVPSGVENLNRPPAKPETMDMLKRAGSDQFVCIIPSVIETPEELATYIQHQLDPLYSEKGLPYTWQMFAGKYGSAVTAAYPVKDDHSPTGYIGLWDVSHRSVYTFNEKGQLVLTKEYLSYRCGWIDVQDLDPAHHYAYPDNLRFESEVPYGNWQQMILAGIESAYLGGHMAAAEKYRIEKE